jgi:hypothetical protein
MMAKTVLHVDSILKLDDIIKGKKEVGLSDSQEKKSPSENESPTKKQGVRLHRAMSDPISSASEYMKRDKKNRCLECLHSHRFCERQRKHTHFANSKQIAQSIYPDFLSSIPNELEHPSDLKLSKIKHRVLEYNHSSCLELSDSKGPSRKSLIEWYGREYGMSFD